MEEERLKTLLAYERYIFAALFKKPLRAIRKIIKNVSPALSVLQSQPEPTPCDLLFLDYGAPLDPLLKRLKKKGFQVRREVLNAKKILFNRMLCAPTRTLPIPLRFYDGVLKFILQKYQPKVVCSLMDHSLLSPFLREELQKRGGRTINISHGVTDPGSIASMFEFDYYFLYGQSSLRHIEANPVRIGKTKAVLTGSPFIGLDFTLLPNYEKKKLLYFSQLSDAFLYASTHRAPLLENANIIINWAKKHPEYHLFIKIHPAEEPEYICKRTHDIRNITVLDKSISMTTALRDVSLVINTASNASIEAAVLNRPTVVVNKSGFWSEYLFFDDFFLPRARTVAELHHNITQTFANYEKFLQNTREFAHFHLEHTTDSVEFMADCIEAIYHGKENFPCLPIDEELSGLEAYF